MQPLCLENRTTGARRWSHGQCSCPVLCECDEDQHGARCATYGAMVMNQQLTGGGQKMGASTAWLAHEGVAYRPPDSTAGEHHALAALQAGIWSDDLATPAHQLIAADSCGGIVIGAFRDRRPVGFSYGFPAHAGGSVWLHSHQTGVEESCRGRGVGVTLKWLQRGLALAAGYALVTWTFDPLRAANANFNFNKLGVTAVRYKPDYYGPMPDPLNVDATTDRLWVEWWLRAKDVVQRFSDFRATTGIGWPLPPGMGDDDEPPASSATPARDHAGLDVVTTAWVRPGLRVPVEGPLLDADAPLLRIEVPTNFAAIRTQCGKAETTAWRMTVRQAFVAAFARGYTATGFTTTTTSEGRRSWYLLTRSDA